MKNSFMTRALAVAMSAAMALSMASAANLTVAEAATTPDMIKTTFAVRAGKGAKSYKANAATQKAFKIVKAVAGNTEYVTKVKISSTGKSIAITAGDVTEGHRTKIAITFKANETGKKVTKKYVCKVLPAKAVQAIEEVKQTEATKMELTLATALTEAKVADFTVVRDNDNSVIAIKDVTIDEADAKKVTIEVYASLKDAKTYTVTYVPAKASAKFTATDGVVAALDVAPQTVVAGKATPFYVLTLDANGVVIDKVLFRNAASAGLNVSEKIKTGFGFIDTDSKITIQNVGDALDITIVKHTYKWVNGVEEGAIEKTVTVTGVANTTVVDGFAYTIGENAPTNWSTLKANTQIAVGDTGRQVYIKVTDSAKADVVTGYYVESSDNNSLLVNADFVDGILQGSIIGVKEGTAYILVKDKTTKNVVKTLPVNVVAKRKLASVSFTNPNFSIAQNTTDKIAMVENYLTVLDQYGDVIKGVNAQPVMQYGPEGYAATDVTWTSGIVSTSTAKVGGYTFTADVYYNGDKITASFYVNVVKTDDVTPAIDVVMSASEDNYVMTSIDTTVATGKPAVKTITPVIVERRSGVITGLAEIAALTEVQIYGASGTVISSGAAISNTAQAAFVTGDVSKVVSGPAATLESTMTAANASEKIAQALKIDVVDKDGTNNSTNAFVKNLAAGTYTVSMKIATGAATDLKTIIKGCTFEVKDSQPVVSVKVLKDTGLASYANAVDPTYMEFYYDGVKLAAGNYSASVATTDYLNVSGSKVYTIQTIEAAIKVPGTADNTCWYKTRVPVYHSFTTN